MNSTEPAVGQSIDLCTEIRMLVTESGRSSLLELQALGQVKPETAQSGKSGEGSEFSTTQISHTQSPAQFTLAFHI